MKKQGDRFKTMVFNCPDLKTGYTFHTTFFNQRLEVKVLELSFYSPNAESILCEVEVI